MVVMRNQFFRAGQVSLHATKWTNLHGFEYASYRQLLFISYWLNST